MFQIRSYSKQELAMLYFPDSDPHTAVNRLMSWVKRCKPLRDALAACHGSKYSKFFTTREIKLIIEYLGEP